MILSNYFYIHNHRSVLVSEILVRLAGTTQRILPIIVRLPIILPITEYALVLAGGPLTRTG